MSRYYVVMSRRFAKKPNGTSTDENEKYSIWI